MTEHKTSLIPASEGLKPIVSLEGMVGLDEMAAIKVSEIENKLLGRQETLRKALKISEEQKSKLHEQHAKQVIEDTRESYPEIGQIEKALESLFGKSAKGISISTSEDGKVKLALNVATTLQFKGKKSKAIAVQMKEADKEIKATEDGLMEVKRGISMLPVLERSAKAAVAKARLSQSKEGLKILDQIQDIHVPGLNLTK